METKPVPVESLRDSNSKSTAGAGLVEQLKSQVAKNKEKSKKSYLFWWSADLARWKALRSPRDTSTLADGSYSVSAELTHPDWTFSGFRLSFGPKAYFFNGGQYAKLADRFFTGNGYADFNSSEVGMMASLVRFSDFGSSDLNWLWSLTASYAPVRWVKAFSASSANMIPRSDTWSRTGLNLPGVGFQSGVGFEWNALLRAELFAGVQGAWPWQVRLRTGVQLSMGLPVEEVPLASR